MAAATAPAPAPTALDLDDPAKYRVVRGVPIFDEHAPATKYVAARRFVAPDNPEGIVAVEIGCTRADLDALARNSNARARSGRPASLQLGHTLTGDVPEHWQPRHVGFPANYRVEDREGRPHLVADFFYRAEEYAEASTYPRCSIERSGWDEPATQFVRHVALIRCPPGRDLPVLAYAADDPGPVEAGADFAVPADAAPDADADTPPPAAAPDGARRMDPEVFKAMLAEQSQTFMAAIAGIAGAITGLADAVKAGNAAPPPPATPAVDDPSATAVLTADQGAPALDYASGAVGGNAVYIPGVMPTDPKHRDGYSRACVKQHDAVASYSASVPGIEARVGGLATLVDTLKGEVEGLKSWKAEAQGKVDHLAAEHELQTANYRNQEYDRILDDAEAKGVLFDREQVRATALDLPEEKRIPFLKDVAVHYKAAPVGAGFVPTGGARPAARPVDPGYAAARIDYATRHYITSQAKLNAEFTYADYQAGKR